MEASVDEDGALISNIPRGPQWLFPCWLWPGELLLSASIFLEYSQHRTERHGRANSHRPLYPPSTTRLEPEVLDTSALREAQIPMPDRSEGYVRVQFVGTTGAGKTTLLRHLIASDPRKDRFPSTSTAKTTMHWSGAVMCPAC
jgi:hypothetical protein